MSTAQTETEAAIQFRAFQRDKEQQNKAVEALRAAEVSDLEEFATWQEQRQVSAEKSTRKPAGASSTGASSTAVAMTDAVLSERVADQVIEGHFCWSSALGWLEWTGKRWEATNQHVVTEAVRQYMIEQVTRKLREPETDWKQRQELMGLLGKSRLVSLVELSKGMKGKVQVRAEVFDTDPDLLNTPSGVVHLPTGEIRPHDPKLYMTRMTPVPYRKGATHPDWQKALQALPPEVIEWFQVRAGQAVTGHMTPDDVMLLLQGGGENGKSTVLESISRCLGDSGADSAGYSCPMSDRVLLANPGDHPTELMDLRGARVGIAEELPEGRRLNVKRLKDTVGTSTMKARRMKCDPVSWSATHSIFLSTNYLPAVEETDHGTWRRLVLLKFPYKFLKAGMSPSAPHERVGDPGIRERMKNGRQQAEAVLAWLVEGARRWYAADCVMPALPETVAADTLQWRRESDLVLGYWLDRLEPDPESHIYSPDLFADFNTWLQGHGHAKWSDKLFGGRFEGHEATAGNGVVRRKIRAKEGLSRPCVEVDQWAPAPPVPATSYRAWLGVRFTTE